MSAIIQGPTRSVNTFSVRTADDGRGSIRTVGAGRVGDPDAGKVVVAGLSLTSAARKRTAARMSRAAVWIVGQEPLTSFWSLRNQTRIGLAAEVAGHRRS